MKRLLSLIGLAAIGCWLFAASLTGYVVDEQGEPLIGAAVKVANSTIGTITDYDGKFELTDILPGTSVEVSYMGYLPLQTQAADGMRVVLMEDVQRLEDVVVCASLPDAYQLRPPPS